MDNSLSAAKDFTEGFDLDTYVEEQYLSYGISVVTARSLPRVEDGMKPVQRRILYDMEELGVGSSDKHRKVAAVIGDTMGKYHPHGDGSIGDALVRMAQNFTLRYPLIDGQGNFGSRDGDGAAAPRYIEARLTPLAELLLSEIHRGTVDFEPNYDESRSEPALLPARLPFVLLNGGKGPAVGYAPEIPSHNLREVVAAVCTLIRNPEATLDEVMAALPGPDFPNGGQIISPSAALREAYEIGKGSVRMRARWRKEDLARGQWKIVIFEMPHESSTAKVLAEIEAASNPKIKEGKKELSQDQKNLKALMLSLIDVARDESCKSEPVRLVIEPKTAKISPDELMNALLAHTSLESNVPINMVMLGRDGNPNLKGIITILKEWIDFRFVTVERRIRFRLDEIARRLHILDGRMLAFAHLDEVIRVIREADDPKVKLIERFGFSEIQAEDILEIRLRQLARLEGFKIENEIKSLHDEQSGLNHLLDNRTAFTNLILSELEADSKKYGDDRRTLIEAVEPVRAKEVSVPDEAVTVILSKHGWLRSRQGVGLDKSSITYRAGDAEMAVIETRTTYPLIVIDNNGRSYSISVSDIPGGRGDGVPITSLITFPLGENGPGHFVHALSGAPENQYFFANSASYGYITTLSKLVTRQKAGKEFMKVLKGESVLTPVPVSGETIAAICEGGKAPRLLMFPVTEMKIMPGGRGVQVMGLGDGEHLSVVAIGSGDVVTVVGVPSSVVIKGEELEKYKMKRARKGCQLPAKLKASKIQL